MARMVRVAPGDYESSEGWRMYRLVGVAPAAWNVEDPSGRLVVDGAATMRDALALLGSFDDRREVSMTYVVIENTPGYLPDDDEPFVTDDLAVAVAYLDELVGSYCESIMEVTPGQGYDMWRAADGTSAFVTDLSRSHDLGRTFDVIEIEEDES